MHNPESQSVQNLSLALQQSLDRYMAKRREIIPTRWENLVSFSNCFQIQARSFLKDLICNPLNTLWAIPFLSIRKVLEVCDKLGLEISGSVLPLIPSSIKTDFQKEIERSIQVDLFGLSEDPAKSSELAMEIENDEQLKMILARPEWKEVIAQAEADIRQAIADFCTTHNGFTDLAASSGIVYVAHRIFRDSSLDIFGIGKRWAATWSRDSATSHFFFGKKLGNMYYHFVPPPPPTSKQVFWATVWSMGLLALFSTAINVLSYPVQNKIGFQKKQIQRLMQAVEDKLLLRFTKNLKAYQSIGNTLLTGKITTVEQPTQNSELHPG